jgi:2-keto-4-pentenoate hydratase/2-oxohepta-3-ene-1,7-dioic acid hydratase in catechol pathway
VKLVNVWDGERRRVGVLVGDAIRRLEFDGDGPAPDSTDDVVRPPDAGPLRAGSEAIVAESFLPAVARPGKIVCVGLNYRRHIEQTRNSETKFPTFFAKFATSLAAHGSAIAPPHGTQRLDYEGELAVVIGRGGRNIPKEEALGHVFGYTVANDFSARDLQHRTSQWLSGKAPDGFCPLGPFLVTQDEIGDPGHLRIRTWVNGTLKQDATTAAMIFPIADLVAELSALVTLEPGDVLLTGTPEGTETEREEPRWLQPGDAVEVEIERVGRLRNRVAAP